MALELTEEQQKVRDADKQKAFDKDLKQVLAKHKITLVPMLDFHPVEGLKAKLIYAHGDKVINK